MLDTPLNDPFPWGNASPFSFFSCFCKKLSHSLLKGEKLNKALAMFSQKASLGTPSPDGKSTGKKQCLQTTLAAVHFLSTSKPSQLFHHISEFRTTQERKSEPTVTMQFGKKLQLVGPKPNVAERMEVDDAVSLLLMEAQKHVVMKDRSRLKELADVSSGLMTGAALLPQALQNIKESKDCEVLLEELEGKRVVLRKLTHIHELAEEEHQRLTALNSSLLLMAKRKDDHYAQLIRQHRIAGAIDADAHNSVLELEERRVQLVGFEKIFEEQIAKLRGEEKLLEARRLVGAPVESTPAAGGDLGLALMRHSQQRRRMPTLNEFEALQREKERNRIAYEAALKREAEEAERRAAGGSSRFDGPALMSTQEVERRMFNLRMSGHELLKKLSLLVQQAATLGVDDGDAAVWGQTLRAMMEEASDCRSDAWLFSCCTRSDCDAVQRAVARLEKELADLLCDEESKLESVASSAPSSPKSRGRLGMIPIATRQVSVGSAAMTSGVTKSI